MFELRIQCDGNHRTVPLSGGTLWRIGRDEECEIFVSDRRVSGQHAEITNQGGKFVLRRTRGQRPIEINGAPVETVELCSGLTFSIGHTLFTLMTSHDGMNLIDTNRVLAGGLGESSAFLPQVKLTDAPAGVDAISPPSVPSALMPQTTSMRLFAQLSALLTSASDRQSLAMAVLELAQRRLQATRALLAKVESSEHLELIAARGIEADSDIKSLISTTVLKQIIDERQAVIIGNTARSGTSIGRQDSIIRNHIRAVACTPVMNTSGKLSALLYVDNQDRTSEFSAQDAELLIWLGQIYSLLDDNLEMRRRLEAEVTELKRAAQSSVEIIAEAPAMVLLLERVKKAAASEAAVMILGESGSGKECIARMLHRQSAHASKPFVARNCAAIPENLFESEMFGHKKGAFTGADSERKGAFAEADGGTLFLDEIGDLEYALQTKLLRAIQERVIRPVGSDKDVPVDVRVVSATNKDLREACKNKQFREDLFYRLATVTLNVPALRERLEDVALLARHFVRLFSSGARSLTPAAEQRLLTYQWPGNVRELRAIMEQAVIFSAGSEISADELNLPSTGTSKIDLSAQSLAEVERRHILHTLQQASGNKTEAAKVLGLARSTLLLKLQSYGKT